MKTARGSVQLRHREGCDATGKDPRTRRCAPTAYVVIDRQWAKVGYLERGWRKADLRSFEDLLVEMRAKYAAGQAWQPKKALRLAEWAHEWFEGLHAAALAGRISRLTYNTYVGSWENHLAPAFGALPLAAIDAAAIRRYVNDKLAGEDCITCTRTANAECSACGGSGWVRPALAANTVNSTLTRYRRCSRTPSTRDSSCPTRPVTRRARHGGSRRGSVLADAKRFDPKWLEPHEAVALVTATAEQYRAMVLMALTTGARRGELLALRWEDIDWATRRVQIDGQLQRRQRDGYKYGSERSVVLYSRLATALGPRRRAEGLIFLDPEGRAWDNCGPERAFLRDAYEVPGLRRPGQMWHVLRHTYASVLAAGGIRRDVVERLMGRQSKGVTSLYTHLFQDAFEGVDEALDAVFGVDVNRASTARTVPNELDGDRRDDVGASIPPHGNEFRPFGS